MCLFCCCFDLFIFYLFLFSFFLPFVLLFVSFFPCLLADKDSWFNYLYKMLITMCEHKAGIFWINSNKHVLRRSSMEN